MTHLFCTTVYTAVTVSIFGRPLLYRTQTVILHPSIQTVLYCLYSPSVILLYHSTVHGHTHPAGLSGEVLYRKEARLCCIHCIRSIHSAVQRHDLVCFPFLPVHGLVQI